MGLFLIAATTPLEYLQWTGAILLAIVGLGSVIFVHELGHFLVAKACGVRCDKFFLGFDIGGYKISHKWGETEYGIGILPLGGYVRMLGQDDDPRNTTQQLKESEAAARGGETKEVRGPGGEVYHIDKRSYLAKNVPQRMAIISAGVVMNILFAFLFAAWAVSLGVPYTPAVLSGTVAGSPAWQAGLAAGDEVIEIAGHPKPTYDDLRSEVMLGNLESGVPIKLVRGASDPVSLLLKPKSIDGGAPRIGVLAASSLQLPPKQPATPGMVAASAGFMPSDRILEVDGQAIERQDQFEAILFAKANQEVTVTVERLAGTAGQSPTKADVKLPPQPLRQLGLVIGMGPVVAVRADSPAAAAGIEPGEVITAINGEPVAAVGADGQVAWDPATLPIAFQQRFAPGDSVELTLSKPGSDPAAARTVSLTVAKMVEPSRSSPGADCASAINSLGLAYQTTNLVAAVIADSPAATAGLVAGDKLVTLLPILPKKAANEAEQEFLDAVAAEMKPLKLWDEPNWPVYALGVLQYAPQGTQFELGFQRGPDPQTVKLEPKALDSQCNPDRGLLFLPLERKRTATSAGDAIGWAKDQTWRAMTSVYRLLSKIGHQVSVTAVGGPIMIAKAAAYSAFDGLGRFLMFLTLISANLAVVNFLPIPVLDGGHMVFLAYEAIMGRPASEKVMGVLNLVGLALILTLMIFVFGLDLGLIERKL